MQPVEGLSPVTYSSRHGDQRWSTKSEKGGVRNGGDVDRIRRGRGFGGFGLAVDQIFQFLARLEVRDLLRRHVHLVARLRIAALARLALAQAEAAESTQLDLLATMQRIDDALEHRI